MTGPLGEADLPAPIDDRWFEITRPGRRIPPGSGLPRRSAAFTVYSSQASTTTWASSSVENSSTLNSSSRTRLLNDSTNGFSHGEPGSMKLFRVPGMVKSGSAMWGGR